MLKNILVYILKLNTNVVYDIYYIYVYYILLYTSLYYTLHISSSTGFCTGFLNIFCQDRNEIFTEFCTVLLMDFC